MVLTSGGCIVDVHVAVAVTLRINGNGTVRTVFAFVFVLFAAEYIFHVGEIRCSVS